MDVQSAPADVLTPDQRDQIDAFLGSPIKYPPEFKQWLTDYLAVNIPPIPVSQLLGYKPTLAHNEIVNPDEPQTSPERTWVDIDTYGPAVPDLSDGTYFCAWGAKTGRGNAGGATTRIGLSVNGADPAGFNYATFQANDPDAMVWKACLATARNGKDNNEIRLKYWFDLGGGASAQFAHRWLTVIRVT